jgi:small ligand-binding sensory domain FIST
VSANGVISNDHELEEGVALSVMAARLPGVTLSPFLVLDEVWAGAASDAASFAAAAPETKGAELVLLWGDPFSLRIERVLAGFNRFAPGVRVVGGMASAAGRPRANALLLNDWIASEGGIGIAFSGALRADVIVSQGCRAIGPTLTVTRAQQNVVVEFDGQPALERTEQILQELPESERESMKYGLYVGRPVRAGAEGRGDYLIRNLLGADRDRGVIAIGDVVREQERLRFHVRDADTAREDLELLLAPQEFDSRASGALLFACNGRGVGLYGRPDGDLDVVRAGVGDGVAVSGMFCAGEIGPVGEKNFLHGQTACVVVMRGAPPRS